MHPSFFRQTHPFATSSYYIAALLIVMSTTNPVIITCFFLSNVLLRLLDLNGKSKKSMLYPFFFIGMITVTNPLFVHRGATVIFFFLNKPITVEAFIYGFFMGMTIATVIYLFQNFQKAVDSEQFFYLFGKRFPKSGLILVLVLRLLPLLQKYHQELNQIQKNFQQTHRRHFFERARYGLDLFGHLFSWSLENAMDTADSMRARGYGVSTRSSCLTYRWQKKDTLFLTAIVLACLFFMVSMIKGFYQFNYYPYHDNVYRLMQKNWLSYLFLFGVAWLPLLKRLKEVIVWNILKSKI